MGREICYFNYNSRHCDKCEFALKLIRLLAVSNLFLLDVVQKIPTLPTLCITGKLFVWQTLQCLKRSGFPI